MKTWTCMRRPLHLEFAVAMQCVQSVNTDCSGHLSSCATQEETKRVRIIRCLNWALLFGTSKVAGPRRCFAWAANFWRRSETLWIRILRSRLRTDLNTSSFSSSLFSLACLLARSLCLSFSFFLSLSLLFSLCRSPSFSGGRLPAHAVNPPHQRAAVP